MSPRKFRQTDRWRRIGQGKPDDRGHCHRQDGGNEETEPPIGGKINSTDEETAKQYHPDAANIMGKIPNGEFGGELFWGKPIGHEPRARRKSHALEPAINHPY